MSLPKLMSSRPSSSSISNENTSYNYQDSQPPDYIREECIHQRESIKDIFHEDYGKDEPKEQDKEMAEETLEERAIREDAKQGMFSQPIYKGEGFHRACSFQESECGEPVRPQHLQMDFTPIEGVDDNEYTVNKCHDFWEFIKRNPCLQGLQAMPSTYNDNAFETTKEPRLSDPIEPTAIGWLKHDGSSVAGPRHSISRKSMGPSVSTKLPSSDEAKILCKQLEDWDLSHPKSMEGPGHPPKLCHAVMQTGRT